MGKPDIIVLPLEVYFKGLSKKMPHVSEGIPFKVPFPGKDQV